MLESWYRGLTWVFRLSKGTLARWLLGRRGPSVKRADVLGVHAQKHSLVIDLDQHHFILQSHGVDFQDLYPFVQMFGKWNASFFIEPP